MPILALNTSRLSRVHASPAHIPSSTDASLHPRGLSSIPLSLFDQRDWSGIKNEEKDTGVATNHSTFAKVHFDAE
jgi:hypothetical protein